MLAFHGIFSAYGFWLPNDPRGSWSAWVGAWELFRYGGAATKIATTQSVAALLHDRQRRQETKRHLKYPPVVFSGEQARFVGQGFHVAARKVDYRIPACAILPEHVHVVVAAHRHKPSAVIGHLKREATLQLVANNIHPFRHHFSERAVLPSCWAERAWKVFLDTDDDVDRAIRYVEANPEKEGKPGQRWLCITPQ